MFYVYEWFNINNKEIFYVGKGCRNRNNQICKRNRLFKEYISKNQCSNKIIKYFEKEEDALKYEKNRIIELKEKGMCFCNLDNGGKGGVNFIWTNEMKKYMSKYNPMKSNNQRKRMSEKNPMKNKNISKKVAETKKRKVVINNIEYNGLIDASKEIGVATNTILNWVKRGYDTFGNPCRYYNKKQEQYDFKKTCSKKVIIDDKIFNSVKEASDFIGVWSETLIRAIKNNRKCKNHTCKYDNQQASNGNQ